jgi:hypothetical protein
VPEYFKVITVIPVETGRSTKPHKPLRILKNAGDLIVRQPVTYIKVRTPVLIALRKIVRVSKKQH